jgi:hypothetical protein
MHIKSKLKLLALLLAPALSIAGNASHSVNYAFLKNGFNMQAYQTCNAELQKCPIEHGFPTDACAKKAVKNTSDCKQLNMLTEKLHGILGLVTATAADKFAIITQQFPADGQEEHYIISPLGYLVKTNIDPRSIDASLAQRYKDAEFFTKTDGNVEADMATDGEAHFTVPLRITKACAACEVLGVAKVQFNFTRMGKPMKTRLVSFQEGNGGAK